MDPKNLVNYLKKSNIFLNSTIASRLSSLFNNNHVFVSVLLYESEDITIKILVFVIDNGALTFNQFTTYDESTKDTFVVGILSEKTLCFAESTPSSS